MISKLLHEKKYDAGRKVHQYYRDVLSQNYQLPELGSLSHQWISKILSSGDYNLLLNIEEIFLKTSYDSKKHKALRLMLMIIFQANLILDINNQNKSENYNLPYVYNQSIINTIEKLLQMNVHEGYMITSMQILYRIGEFEIFNYLANKNKNIVNSSTILLKIRAMIHSYCHEYHTAKSILNKINEVDKKVIPISILDITCDYKLSLPSSFIYSDKFLKQPSINKFKWIKEPTDNNQKLNRVFVACDPKYFFKHVLFLVKSILYTNKSNLFLHIHIYNLDEKILNEIDSISKQHPELDISASYEMIDEGNLNIRTHYASRRFVALFFLRKLINNNILAIDADSLFNSTFNIPNDLQNKSIVSIYPLEVPFWEKIPACFLFLSKSELCLKFLSQIAKLIEANLISKNNFWFLDQLVLAISFDAFTENEKKSLGHIDINQVCDTNCDKKSMIWQLSTDKKNKHRFNEYSKKLSQLI